MKLAGNEIKKLELIRRVVTGLSSYGARRFRSEVETRHGNIPPRAR